MSFKSDNQREREVIRLLYDLLLKWDEVLELTDQTICSIARKQNSTLQQRTHSDNGNSIIQTEQSSQTQTNDQSDDQKPSNNKKTNKKVSPKDKTNKKSKTSTNKKRNSYANNLEENLMKLDGIIEFYEDLKRRALRTIISHGKTSNAAKDVNQEIKDEIERFQLNSIN